MADDPPFAEKILKETKTFGRLEVMTIADMRKPNLTTRPLVKGLIDQESVNLFYGDQGCGKTFLALDIGLCVAAGMPWFGKRTVKGGVVYVAAEGGRRIKNRVAAWLQQRDCEVDIPFAAVVSPVNLCGLEPGDVDKLIAAFKPAHVPVTLVIIDTVSRSLAGGNENAPDDMGAFIAALDELRDRLRCAVIAIHHTGKDEGRGPRGHSLLDRAMDGVVFIKKYEEQRLSVATVTKQRDGEEGEKIAFWLRQVELGTDQDGDLVTTCVVMPSDEIPEEQPKGRRGREASPQAMEALAALYHAVHSEGTPGLANGEWSPKRVTETVWKDYMGRSGKFGQPKDKRFMNAYRRSKTALLQDGRIALDGEWVWPVVQAPF